MLLVHLLLLLLLSSGSVWTTGQPHIIFILADDMGWNDVSFHGSDQIPTPNMDALAFNGVILNQHYVQPLCTPTRAALMTGRYPIHTGMQGLPMFGAEPRGLPLSVRILPQYLKDLGYTTRLVGKWHLGFFRREYTPTYRGFDSHLGYWTGSISYFDHVLQDVYSDGTILSGHDFRRNMTTDWDDDGRYATDVFTDEAVRLIREHGTTAGDSRPLFLLVSHLAAHAGNAGKLLEAPQETVNRFRYISDPNRRTYAAMISKMDDSVGRIVETLDEQNMLRNSIIVFLSDNGAPSVGVYQNWGSNYPLKGIKATLWEGGVRGAAFIWSPHLQQTPRVSNQLMHVTDWLPTLYAIAGGNPSALDRDVDGFNMWDAISYAVESPRQQILLNIDEASEVAAIRVRNWKLVLGTLQNGTYDTYFGDSGYNLANPPYELALLFTSPAGRAITHVQGYMTSASEINQLRHQATIRCNMPGQLPVSNCQITGTRNACLFDLLSDPCEVNDLASNYPDVARVLYNILVQYRGRLVPQLNRPIDAVGADPRRFNNTWSPWLDSPYA